MPQNLPIATAANLILGQVYRVKAAFTDYDGITHPVGETWRFVSKSFLPYEDGLGLMVEQEGQREMIRLQWRPEAQAEIIEGFAGYVEAVDPASNQPAESTGKRSRLLWIILAISILILVGFICLALVGIVLYFLNGLA